MSRISQMFGAISEDDKAEFDRDTDFVRGFEAASIAVLTIEKQMREAFPNQSDIFYRGMIAGIRKEL